MQPNLTRLQGTTHLLILPFPGGVLLPTTPGDCRGSDNSIRGQVRGANGGPLPSGITAKLEVAKNVVVAQQMVGAAGTFTFQDLTAKSYQIIVTAEGYQPAGAQADMQHYAGRCPTVYLTPLGPKKTCEVRISALCPSGRCEIPKCGKDW